MKILHMADGYNYEYQTFTNQTFANHTFLPTTVFVKDKLPS